MEKINLLIRGLCPICNKIIMNDKKTAYNEYGMEFWVKWNDDRMGQFAICKDCFKTLTQEQVDNIMSRQIVNWGTEVQQQLSWYINTAVHLKITKWKKRKEDLDAISPTTDGS